MMDPTTSWASRYCHIGAQEPGSQPAAGRGRTRHCRAQHPASPCHPRLGSCAPGLGLLRAGNSGAGLQPGLGGIGCSGSCAAPGACTRLDPRHALRPCREVPARRVRAGHQRRHAQAAAGACLQSARSGWAAAAARLVKPSCLLRQAACSRRAHPMRMVSDRAGLGVVPCRRSASGRASASPGDDSGAQCWGVGADACGCPAANAKGATDPPRGYTNVTLSLVRTL